LGILQQFLFIIGKRLLAQFARILFQGLHSMQVLLRFLDNEAYGFCQEASTLQDLFDSKKRGCYTPIFV